MIPIFVVFAAQEKGISSNINEVIKTVLNFLLFFTKRFYKYTKPLTANRNKKMRIKNI